MSYSTSSISSRNATTSPCNSPSRLGMDSPTRAQVRKQTIPFTPTHRSFTYPEKTPTVEKILQIIDEGAINGRSIRAVNGLRGQHSQIYEFTFDHTPKKPMMDRADLYVKIFHERCLQQHPRQADKFLATMMQQNSELKESRLPVVKIMNEDRVLEDKYLLVEKLDPMTFPWDSRTRMPLDMEQERMLDEVIAFFQWAAQNPSSIPLDIRPSNFGLRNGQLVLLDLMEHKEDEPYAFKLHADRCAKEMAKGNSFIYETIKTAVINANPSYEEHF